MIGCEPRAGTGGAEAPHVRASQPEAWGNPKR